MAAINSSAEHHNVFDQGVVYSAFIFEHLKHVRPEKGREVIQINLFGHGAELAVLATKAFLKPRFFYNDIPAVF